MTKKIANSNENKPENKPAIANPLFLNFLFFPDFDHPTAPKMMARILNNNKANNPPNVKRDKNPELASTKAAILDQMGWFFGLFICWRRVYP